MLVACRVLGKDDPVEQLVSSRVPELSVSEGSQTLRFFGMARSPAQIYGTVSAQEVSAGWDPLCPQGSRTAHCLPELSWAARLPPGPNQLCLDRTLDRTREEDARGAYPIRR